MTSSWFFIPQPTIYSHPVALWGISGKKATEIRLLVPLYISVRPSSCNNWRNAECIIMNLCISDIYYNPLTRNNCIYQRTLRIKPACILLASPLNIQWNKRFETAFTPKLYGIFLSHCIYVNWFGSLFIKMNARIRLLLCTYISLSTVNSKFELVHSVDHIRASELFLLWELTNFCTDLWICVSLSAQDLCCSQNNLFTFLSTQHSLMQISKLRQSICHISQAFIFQIFI